MTFKKAELDESNGTIILEPGIKYFFDTQESDVFPSVQFGDIKEDLLVSIPNSAIANVVRSGSGQVMVEVHPSTKTIVPNEVATKTGFFYILPTESSLRAAQKELYGSNYDEPRGFFEFLADNNPDLLKHMINVAEGVKEVTDKVANSGKKLVTTIVIGALAIAIAAIAISKLKKG